CCSTRLDRPFMVPLSRVAHSQDCAAPVYPVASPVTTDTLRPENCCIAATQVHAAAQYAPARIGSRFGFNQEESAPTNRVEARTPSVVHGHEFRLNRLPTVLPSPVNRNKATPVRPPFKANTPLSRSFSSAPSALAVSVAKAAPYKQPAADVHELRKIPANT